MRPPDNPPDEDERIVALRELGLLDTPPEERFDRLTRLLLRIFQVPIAYVALVDVNRQWFKSCYGLDASETSREVSFCGHAILEKEMMIIPDARLDDRFYDNPLVTGPPQIRFYAGHVLRGPRAQKVGTLCLVDSQPRTFSEADRQTLRDLAALAERELNQAEVSELQKQLLTTTTLQRAILNGANYSIVSTDPTGLILTFNRAAERLLGYQASELVGQTTPALLHDPAEVARRAEALTRELGRPIAPGFEVFVAKARDGGADENQWTYLRKDGSRVPVALSVTALFDADGAITGFLGIACDITERKQAEEAVRAAQAAQERLLLNILPQPVADRLKAGPSLISDCLPEATILFAELHDFARLTDHLPAADVVKLLNEIVSRFDRLVLEHGLEKIKTIANAYMVAGGVPVPRPDHAAAVADLALAMQQDIVQMVAPGGVSFRLRIGLDTGPVVAGVIGTTKFTYDLWGDTVNTAWEMATLGVPGNIQVSEATESRLRGRYSFETRGEYYLKGKGTIRISFLKGKRRAAAGTLTPANQLLPEAVDKLTCLPEVLSRARIPPDGT
ncbi:MAG: PAS domain S-box protein [Verrucomicrobia bacterium]|nr:PAS domain S-box protein [Verrucomicrobiota bacterium]